MTSVSCVEDPADGTNAASPLTGNGGFDGHPASPSLPATSGSCTETNTHKGTITVVKHLVPSTDTGLFDLFIDAHQALGVGDGGSLGPITLEAGNHNVVENEHATGSLANYVTSVACVESNADGVVSPLSPLTGSGGFEIVTVPVAAGDQWTCTETNTHKGTIEVVKQLVPSTDPGRFDLSVDGTDRSEPRRRRHHRVRSPSRPATTTCTRTSTRPARSRTT